MWNRFRKFLTVAEQPFLKHGNCEPEKNSCWIFNHFWLKLKVNLLLLIISTILTIRSCCLRAAFRPASRSRLKSVHNSESGPPITSRNSGVSLNGDCSKPLRWISLVSKYHLKIYQNLPKFFGEMLRMKPKSMCIRWPSEWSKMFPLCLKWFNYAFSKKNLTYITKSYLSFTWRR